MSRGVSTTTMRITWLTLLVVFILELIILNVFLPIPPVSHPPFPHQPSRAPSRGHYNLEPPPRKLYEY